MDIMGENTRSRELFETGAEPDYSIYDLERWEDAGDGNIRVYLISRRGSTDRTEYSVTCTPERLALMCRKGLTFAAEACDFSHMAKIAHGH